MSFTISISLPIFIATKPIQSDAKEGAVCSLEKSKFTDNHAFRGIYKLDEIDLFTKKNKQTEVGPFYPYYNNI